MKNLIFAASILLFASWTHAAGFDCNKASTLVEKAICSDSELSKLDDLLMISYKEALRNISDTDKLKSEQRDWLSNTRNKCQDADCLKRAYNKRISDISTVTVGLSAHAEQTTKLDARDFVVADISIGMSKVNVKKIIGNPKSEKNRKGVTGNFTELNYTGLTVILSDEKVFGMTIESAKYATNRGLHVGDSVKKLLEIYENPASRDGQDMDYNDDEGGLIRIRIKKDRVEWIYVGALDD